MCAIGTVFNDRS